MKKTNFVLVLTVFVLLLTSLSFNLNAQKFEKGTINGNFMIGLGNTYHAGYGMGLPLISLSGDMGLVDTWGPGVFGVGAMLGVSTSKNSVYSTYTDKYTDIIFAPRATYHYQFVKKLDTYGGIAIGLRFQRGKFYDPFTGNTDVAENHVYGLGSIFVGARYYFTEKFAAMAELGFGTAIFNIGVSMKFK
jgi:hypothetical protein